MKLLIGNEWLRKRLASDGEEPGGCSHCGAIAGCCAKYPDCPGGEEAKAVERERASAERADAP